MPPPGYTDDERAKVRARIINAARTLFEDVGIDGISIREIAARCGYSGAALYRYFPNRAALIQAMWKDALDDFGRAAHTAVETADGPLQQVAAFLRAYADFAAAQPDAFRTTFLTIWKDNSERLIVSNPQEDTPYRLLRACVSQAIGDGVFVQGAPDLIAQTLWAAIHGATALEINFGDFPLFDRERRIQSAIETVLGGLIPHK